MKKGKKLLMVLCSVLILTGCTTKELKNAYNSMTIGDGDNEINGYSLSIRLFGLYEDEKISQSVKITNYLEKDFKVVDSSEDQDVTYYIIDGVNYKSVIVDEDDTNTGEEGTETDDLDVTETDDPSLIGDSFVTQSVTFEETKDDVPFTNTNLYLTSLKSAKKVGDAVEEEIGELKYTTYEFKYSKGNMAKMLKGTVLEDIKFKEDISAKVWIDSDGYVYKIEYDLASGLETDTTLALNVYYNSVNQIDGIDESELGLDSLKN